MAIKLKSLLLERHQEDLYHATFEGELLDILSDNSIKLAFVGGTFSDQQLNKGYPFFLSTMRSKYGNYARGNSENTDIRQTVIIHLNGSALTAAGYKTFWVDYWGNGPKLSEEEERIASNKDEIKPLKNFIKDIHVYIKSEITNPHLLERLHKIDDLTGNFPFPIYFYPPAEAQGFKAQRTERAVRSIQNIVPQPEFTVADQEHREWLKTHNSPSYSDRQSKILRIFLDIYYDKKVDTSTYPGKSVMEWLLYYPHDAQSQIACEIHNLKRTHAPIFREFVEIMKDKGFKTVREFVEFVIKRETERNQERQKIERKKDLDRIKLESLIPDSTVVPLIVYHGTGQAFKKFDINQAAQGIIWFASDKEKILSGNSGACNIKYIITAEVTIKHPAGWDAYEKMGIGELRIDGYDGLMLSDKTTGKFDCAVFSERQIKIKKIESNPSCKSI